MGLWFTAIGTGAIDADAIAANAITAAKIATGAIDADSLAADAITSIAGGVWNEPKAGHVAAGSFGEEEQAHSLSTEITALNNVSTAQVNTEVSDVLKVDTMAELAQGVPAATPTFEAAMMRIYMAIRNKLDVTATLKSFTNDAGVVIWKKVLSDTGTVYSEAEGVTGP